VSNDIVRVQGMSPNMMLSDVRANHSRQAALILSYCSAISPNGKMGCKQPDQLFEFFSKVQFTLERRAASG
jgi:hypothetical protein